MAEGPAYVILGRGRWAKKMQAVLAGEGQAVTAIEETRQRTFEETGLPAGGGGTGRRIFYFRFEFRAASCIWTESVRVLETSCVLRLF
jgi:hypothetical protein